MAWVNARAAWINAARHFRSGILIHIRDMTSTLSTCIPPSPSILALLSTMAELTGRMPLPPRWTIGYHQCRWGYMNEQEVQQVAAEMRKRNHPCDAIWLDIDYMNGYRDFTWDAERFPRPEQLTEYLHAQGMRL